MSIYQVYLCTIINCNHDGKWLMFNVSAITSIEKLKKLLKIKKRNQIKRNNNVYSLSGGIALYREKLKDKKNMQ